MVIKLSSKFLSESLDWICMNLIGKNLYCLYPYLHEAFCVSIMNESFTYEIDTRRDGEITKIPHGNSEVSLFAQCCKTAKEYHSMKLGCEIGDINIVCQLKKLKGSDYRFNPGMVYNQDGSFVKEFMEIVHVPIQTLVIGSQYEDPRYVNIPPPSTRIEYPVGVSAFFLSSTVYGSVCKVENHQNDDTVCIKVRVYFDLS